MTQPLKEREQHIIITGIREKAYGRAWEAVLGVLAGADNEFVQNEVREAQIAALVASEVFPNVRQRLMDQFVSDIARCKFGPTRTKEAIRRFALIFGIDDEMIQLASVDAIEA